jgi:dynein heavy chain
MSWGHIDTIQMEDDIKKLRRILTDMKGLDRKSKVYMGIFEELKNWATFLPLLGELKDPSMEVPDGRHWRKI